MAEKVAGEASALASVNKWAPIVALGWLIPGAGHFFLGKRLRGGLLFASVTLSFMVGMLMRGYLFEWQTGDLFTTLIYCGGYIANLASGVPYLFAKWLGYSEPDMAGHVVDYGTKFLVCAGLMNILAMVDAFEIATGKKD
ncbi:MAG TPA: DUF6677 family protein [Bryobacteraceae bacterium]|jgi:uncharacterized protein DUF6677|nr:DUF6677 family protein [Bryobacteraceae bacterium]